MKMPSFSYATELRLQYIFTVLILIEYEYLGVLYLYMAIEITN